MLENINLGLKEIVRLFGSGRHISVVLFFYYNDNGEKVVFCVYVDRVNIYVCISV